MKKLILTVALLTSGLVVVGSANAATAASTLNVSATITSDCTVGTTPVGFGNVVSGSGAVASGSVDVTCTVGTPYSIALDAGGSFDGTDRRITDGTDFLIYTLTDNASATAWGDDGVTIAGASVPGTGTAALVSHIVDATLTGAAVPAGTYTDTVNVTVTY